MLRSFRKRRLVRHFVVREFMLAIKHKYQDLIRLFDDTFYQQFNTRLIKGDDEPIYLPANDKCFYHQVVFAHGYFASALHEIAHWCIAGAARRKQIDYGYWYEPDGRTAQMQRQFEQVEIAPQAIEWAFSLASNKAFNVSVDNLNGEAADRSSFQENVKKRLLLYTQNGFPERAESFLQALHHFYGTPSLKSFKLEDVE